MLEGDVDPTFGLCKFEGGERDEIMVAGTGKQRDAGGRVGLVGFEVEE
jgi:hypothetical protein